jgi:hypothetical protein
MSQTTATPDDMSLDATTEQRSPKRLGGITGRGFMPGQCGNPAGRSKANRNIEALARSHGPEAIAALVVALNNPRERVQAAVALLDRGFGKPKQNFTPLDEMPELGAVVAPLLVIQPVRAIDVEAEPQNNQPALRLVDSDDDEG